MVGSALVRALRERGAKQIITAKRNELDLRNEEAVGAFLRGQQPEIVMMAAARIGGITAYRESPADFLYDNIAMQNAVIRQSWSTGVRQLVLLGSATVYPRDAPQPMKEEYFLSGPLEPTVEPYAIAKIAGIRMSQAFHAQHGLGVLNPLPSNLYGTNDNYDPRRSQVVASLIKRFCDAADSDASEVVVWGSGNARREFLHVDDCAEAILFLTERWASPEIINVGSGEDVSIRELASLIAKQSGYSGRIIWDTSKPDGAPRKWLDSSRLRSLGFRPRIALEDGIAMTVAEYRKRRGDVS